VVPTWVRIVATDASGRSFGTASTFFSLVPFIHFCRTQGCACAIRFDSELSAARRCSIISAIQAPKIMTTSAREVSLDVTLSSQEGKAMVRCGESDA
jgi:hypothetical protein